MPAPKFRARTYRRVYSKLPGNRVTIHYEKRKPSKAQCGSCGKQLAGVPRERKTKLINMPKTMKRPERPYGGVLCSSCMRKRIKLAVRNN